MKYRSSRRDFLAAGLALTGLRTPLPAPMETGDALKYRTLGRTGLKVTTVGCGCLVSADVSVIE